MSAESFDLVVLGSGPAGEKGAAQAAYFGKRVALVEKAPVLGGAGINTGTVPSKTLRETALYFSGLRQRGLYGVDYTIKKDITVPDFMYREAEVVRALRTIVAGNLDHHGVEVVRGRARFDDAHTIVVDGADGQQRRLRADVILIATGSYPNWPDDTPTDPRLYDSDTILQMDRLPRSLLVVGAGVIGCEYATMFRAMGIDVSLMGGHDRLLPFLDEEIGDRWKQQVERLGVRILLREAVAGLALEAPDVGVLLKTGGRLDVERVLFATGRMGATQGLGLEALGIAPGRRGHLEVNANYQTKQPHIYAAGDVIGFPALASTSMEQARVAMCHAFDIKYREGGVSELLPMAVYTIPELAAVGETEETCKKQNIPYSVGRAYYEKNSRGQIVGDMAGLLKLVFRVPDRKLLGVHILGEMASELVHVGQACLHFGGGLDDFIASVFNYPTLGETYKYAAFDGLGNMAKAAPPRQD